MKFIISTQELNYLISKCLNIVAQKATVPILGNILVTAKGDKLTLTATDLTVGVRCATDAKILEEGATTLPAKRFAQLIRELTAANVEVSTNENDVTEIVADSSRFRLHGMSESEFPELPDIKDATQFTLDQLELKNMLFRTSFAVSREDTRYVLTGVFLQVRAGKASFVGTDGKRLARNALAVPLDPSFSGDFIIPLKAVEEIQKGLDDEGSACVYLMHDKIAVEANDCILISKLLSGEYPDVSRVIPSQPETVVSLHRDELITLLRQISLFTADTNHSVRFTFKGGELQLTANTMEIGEGKVSMPVNYNGDKLEIAFNPNFFLDILRHSKNESVTMGVTDSFNPGIITDVEEALAFDEGVSPLYVLMPMRLSDD